MRWLKLGLGSRELDPVEGLVLWFVEICCTGRISWALCSQSLKLERRMYKYLKKDGRPQGQHTTSNSAVARAPEANNEKKHTPLTFHQCKRAAVQRVAKLEHATRLSSGEASWQWRTRRTAGKASISMITHQRSRDLGIKRETTSQAAQLNTRNSEKKQQPSHPRGIRISCKGYLPTHTPLTTASPR